MKRVLAITILLFLCFLFTIYFLFPKYSDFKSLEKEISKKENLLQEKEAYFSNLEKISKDLEKYEESFKKVNSALPDTVSLSSLLNFIAKKSSENGMILKSLGIGRIESSKVEFEEGKEKESQSRIKELVFSFNFLGTLSSFENFLKEIEKSSRMIEIENIILNQKEEISEVTLSLKIRSY